MTRMTRLLHVALAASLWLSPGAHAQTPTAVAPGTILPGAFATQDNGLQTVVTHVGGCPATLPDGTPVVVACPTAASGSGSTGVTTGAASSSATPVQNPDGTPVGGTDATGVTAPTGGVGIRGWLSGIYAKLSGSLAVTGTFWQATQPVSLASAPLPAGASQDGTDATGVTAPTGGVGIRGWLSGIYRALTGTLTVGGAVSVSNLPATQPISATALPLPSGAAQDGTDATGVTPPAGAAGVRGWLSGIYRALTGTLAVTDASNTAFLGVVAITPGTPVAAQRSIGFVITTAGPVTFTLADASTITLALPVTTSLIQTLPFAVTNVALGSGTAGTFWNLK